MTTTDDRVIEVTLPSVSELEALETDLDQVAKLKSNRAWLSLKLHLQNRYESEREKLVRAIFRKSAEPVDQRAVDYARGVLDTIEWVFNLPERVEARQNETTRRRP